MEKHSSLSRKVARLGNPLGLESTVADQITDFLLNMEEFLLHDLTI